MDQLSKDNTIEFHDTVYLGSTTRRIRIIIRGRLSLPWVHFELQGNTIIIIIITTFVRADCQFFLLDVPIAIIALLYIPETNPKLLCVSV